MNDELDALLQHDLLQPPADFTRRVMHRLPPWPHPTPSVAAAGKVRPAHWSRLRRLATAAGLIGGGLLGLSQLAGFVFGLWVASTAI